MAEFGSSFLFLFFLLGWFSLDTWYRTSHSRLAFFFQTLFLLIWSAVVGSKQTMNLVFLSNYLHTKKDRIPSQVCLGLQYSTVQYSTNFAILWPSSSWGHHHHSSTPSQSYWYTRHLPFEVWFRPGQSGGSHQKDQPHGNDLPAILLGMCLAIGACIPNSYLTTLLVYYLIVPTITRMQVLTSWSWCRCWWCRCWWWR